jgi:hypothetical protein
MPISKGKIIIKYYNMPIVGLTQINENSIPWQSAQEIRWAYAWER